MTEELHTSDNNEAEHFNDGFETAYDIASQESLEIMMQELEDAGFDPDEIEEALYDPAPRRGRRHHGGRKGRRHARRSYDPAPPRRGRKSRSASAYPRKGKKGRKGKLAKFRKFVLPTTTVGSFYLSYAANAKARNLTLLDALKADLSNWDVNKVMTKIQNNPMPLVGTVGVPIVKHMVPDLNKGMMGLVADAVQGIMTGQFLVQVVDEPAPLRSGNVINVTAQGNGNGIPVKASCGCTENNNVNFRNPYA